MFGFNFGFEINFDSDSDPGSNSDLKKYRNDKKSISLKKIRCKQNFNIADFQEEIARPTGFYNSSVLSNRLLLKSNVFLAILWTASREVKAGLKTTRLLGIA